LDFYITKYNLYSIHVFSRIFVPASAWCLRIHGTQSGGLSRLLQRPARNHATWLDLTCQKNNNCLTRTGIVTCWWGGRLLSEYHSPTLKAIIGPQRRATRAHKYGHSVRVWK